MKRCSVLFGLALLLWPLVVAADYHVDTLTINRWNMPIANYGPFGQGATWRNTSHQYFCGCGLWLGAIQGNDTLVSVSYNPNSGHSELSPGDSSGGPGDTLAKVYIYPHRWPPPAWRFPRAPQTVRSDQDAWTCFNDFDSSSHVQPGRPLDVQVYLTAYAWADELAWDFIFLKYEIENQSEDTLREFYTGITLDPDIGYHLDDMYGAFYHRWFSRTSGDSIYIDHLAYAYDNDNQEPGWDTVGVVGIEMILTPENQGIAAMKKFTIENDPVTDPEQYLVLAGYNCSTRVYEPIDTIDIAPADKRFLVSTGPFSLAPAQTESLVVVILASPYWPDSLPLALAALVAESLYFNRVPAIAEGQQPGPPATTAFCAFPNPFKSSVRLLLPYFQEPIDRIGIYNTAGRLVRTVPISRTTATCCWNGRNSDGEPAPPGVYLARAGRKYLKMVKQE